jgi:hypothetical protein
MDKEMQLLESLKASLAGGSASAASSSSAGSVASSGAGADLQSAIDFTVAVATSVANNPLFYLKLVGVLALTVLIIMISVELVSGG